MPNSQLYLDELDERRYRWIDKKEEEKQMKMRPYQEEAVSELLYLVEVEQKKNIILSAATSFGKEQPYSEPVLTPTGWTTMGNLKIGDQVVGSNGEPIKITHIHEQGVKDVYEITFLDKSKVRCGADHLWTYSENVREQKNNIIIHKMKEKTDSTINIIKKKNALKQKRLYIKTVEPIEYEQSNIELPLDPYTLGILLGDGSFRHKKISLSNNNEHIRKIVEENLPNGDIFSNIRIYGKKHDVDISWNGRGKKGNSKIYNILENLGLTEKYSHEKFIPEIYMKASVKNRMKLLQGLIDTDGYISHKNLNEYSTSSERLANNIIDLARGLGLIVNYSTRIPTYTYRGEKKQGKKSWRIFIRWNRKYKTISSIKKLNYQEKSRCITVDAKDHLYVTSNYTLTHNSIVLSELARLLSGKVIILVNITPLIDQIASHLDELGSDYSILKAGYDEKFDPEKKIQIVMSQTYYSRYENINFGPVEVILQDESHREWNTPRTKLLLNTVNPSSRIGVTGTPYDEAGYALKDVDAIVDTKPINELEKERYISPLKYFIPKWSQEIDYDEMRTSGADYSGVAIDELINTDEYANMVVSSMNYLNCKNKKCVVFANSIEHADTINQALVLDGYNSFSYHSESEVGKSEAAMNSFRNNTTRGSENLLEGAILPPIRCIVAVSKISIGFDVPDIDIGVICRPTKVLSLYRQMCGRILRKADGKDHGIILDLAGVVSNHGFHNEPYYPPIRGDKKKLIQEKENLASPVITSLVKNEPTEVTRKIIVEKVNELKAKEETIPTLPLVDIISIYETSINPKKIIEIGFEINRRKTGTTYTYSNINWAAQPWENAIEKYEDYKYRLIKSLKTMMKNKIARGKKPAGIHYSCEWLLEQTPYCNINEDDSNYDKYHNNDESDYYDNDEIPF
jgi:superfamily II DNA or RNA helicase